MPARSRSRSFLASGSDPDNDFHRSGQHLLDATFDPATGTVASPRVEHDAADLRGYEATVDGGFLAYQRVPDIGIHREVQVVLNWFEELKRMAPAVR